jgi:hypothetical protein
MINIKWSKWLKTENAQKLTKENQANISNSFLPSFHLFNSFGLDEFNLKLKLKMTKHLLFLKLATNPKIPRSFRLFFVY